MVKLPYEEIAGSITVGPLDIADLLEGRVDSIQGDYEAGTPHTQKVSIHNTDDGLLTTWAFEGENQIHPDIVRLQLIKDLL